MDADLLKELGLVDKDTSKTIEYVQKCIILYEQTLKAMGIFPPEMVSQAVDNSQIIYANPAQQAEQYAHVPEHY